MHKIIKQVLFCTTFLTIFFLNFSAKAETLNPKEARTLAIKILKKYNASAAVEMKVLKTEIKKTLGTTTGSEGQLIFSKGKINFFSEKPVKTEIIYNKTVWVIEYPDKDLDEKGVRKVTVLDINKVSFLKNISILFTSPEKILTKEVVFNEADGELHFEVDKLKNESLKKISVSVSLKDKIISGLFLTDDLDTVIHFEIQKTDFLKITPKGKFSYKKQKTDEILKP